MDNVSGEAHQQRPYRSKRHRPCDLCRTRRVCCRVDNERPCYLCRKTGVDCTFIQLPAKKRKTGDTAQTGTHNLPTSQRGSPASGLLEERPGEQDEMDSDFLQSFSQFDDSLRVLDDPHSNAPNWTSLPGMFSFPTISPLDTTQNNTHMRLDPQGDTPDSLARFLCEQDYRLGVAEDPASAHTSPTPTRMSAPAAGQPEGRARSDGPAMTLSDPAAVGAHYVGQTQGPRIRSINDTEGFSAQYFGLSGESDPYLLKHIKYDENHERRYFKVHFRKAADAREPRQIPQSFDGPGPDLNSGQPAESLGEIPVQFMMTAGELTQEEYKDTAFRPDVSREALRQELDALVTPENGMRLMNLHFKFVFPYFPAVSRKVLPKPLSGVSLQEIPTHLLAAIYASSLPFVSHDAHLCVQNVYDKPSENQIWHIALEDMVREIQAPGLSVLQAGLLYLQKPRSGPGAAADTPFKWSFTASLVGLATSLGLHLDCREWSIPPWEKRLRRRLWWLVYSEEKWRSLLLGRPSLIHPDQWDVSELDDEDFVTEYDDAVLEPGQPAWWPLTHAEQCTHFRYLVRLAQTAEEIYRAFYTLRASRRLASDFASSLKAAKPLREQLRNWYSSLPPTLQVRKKSEKPATTGVTMDATAALHFAYLTLEVLLYRALLRPLGPKSPKDAPNINPKDGGDDAAGADDLSAARIATRTAAHNCARLVISFTAALDSLDFGAFWYSWSRIGFPMVTSFVALLVVQAPTPDIRADAMSIADSWRDTLRVQSKSFDQMRLGLLRLDVMYWIGFDELFSM